MENLDPELAKFVEQMEQSARMEKIKHKLTNDCWDVCVTNPNVSKFDSKTEACLNNCVDRFIDSQTHIVQTFSNKLQTEPSFGGGGSSSLGGGFNDSDMILEDKFNAADKEHVQEKPKKSSWW